VRDLGLAADSRVRVRLTGPVPLADEEFATLAQGAAWDVAFMVCGVLALLWLALRAGRLILAVLTSLIAGLAVTAAFGLIVFGRFNLISVAFAVLFVGLGVDFGIQFCVAARAHRARVEDMHMALRGAAGEIGGALALAAASTALGFYAFAPTRYRGVSELGVIAGTGMALAFLASVTFLPALIVVLRAPLKPLGRGGVQVERIDELIARWRRVVLGLGVVLALGSLALLPHLRFDFNPLNLKSPAAESVATLADLSRNPETSPNTIDVLLPSLDHAIDTGKRIAALPEVDHVLSLAAFVPDNQDAKLAAIADAALLLDPVVHATPKPLPSDAAIVQAIDRTARLLDDTKATAPPTIAPAVVRLASALRTIAQGPEQMRARAGDALIPGLVTTISQLRLALDAQPVTLQTLPADLVRDWVSVDGRARIEVYPNGDANDNAVLERFVRAVRQVAPDATGAPVSIQESSRTIVTAFVQAGVLALVAITALLAIMLRHVQSVVLTMAPLLLAGLVTLGICVISRFALNFENIIALPLLFGIGVAFDIYFIMAWRIGKPHLLASSLARAVLFSALTTGTAFGSLWLSEHPGTSSMGELLVLSLLSILATVLVFLPALLHTVTYRE
jgi:hopanoid biosynthesis associated RND transporter like protein HpnN